MTLKTTPWDAAKHLRTPEIIAAYLNEALADGSPELIARALDTIARARSLHGLASSEQELPEPVASKDVEAVQRGFGALGLRLQVAAA